MALDPTVPQSAALPGGTTPAYGQKSFNPDEWRFDYHGFLTAPLNAGIGSRPNALAGQSTTTLHAPPIVPDDFETFSHTSVTPMTYAQLNFSESNGIVSANVSMLARQANVSEGFLEPASQAGITDVYLSYLPDLGRNVRMRLIVGAFTSRYGATGEYDEGRYGMPLIARINGIGEQVTAQLRLGEFSLMLEQGLQGQTNTPSGSITPDVWNEFANTEAGATFVNHFHAGLTYRSLATLGLHFINAQSHDDTVGSNEPDGDLTILGADLRLTMGRFGHFYAAFSSAKATNVRNISQVISVLNTRGGVGLETNYLGPDGAPTGAGNGTLTIAGGQYDLSIGRLISSPGRFKPDGPDVFVSLFGMGVHVSSQEPLTGGVYGDGVTKIKYGALATYSFLPWLAVSARYDQVTPNSSNSDYSFAAVSPSLIFRTGWTATDQVVLQYSHWFDGGKTIVRTGEPPVDAPSSTIPDSDVISLAASMWW
jgi:hypothetical protein